MKNTLLHFKKVKNFITIFCFTVLCLVFSENGWGQIVTFDLSYLPGGSSNYGPSPQPPTSNNANVIIAGLTRGSGVATSGTGAAHGWGGTNFTGTR